MPDGTVPLLIALVLLLVLSAFFSSTETAYSCSSLIKLRSMANGKNKRASKVLRLAEDNYEKLLSTILVGNNIVNLTSATIATIFFAKILTESTVDSSVISTVVITLTVLIFGEITPKFIAKNNPEKTAIAYYYLIIPFYYLFYPFNFVFSGWKWLIKKVFRLKNEEVVTEEEIMTVVEEAEEDGTLKKEETRLIRSVIEFDDLEVGDVLVPRVNMIAIDVETPMEEIKEIFVKEGYSRLPVYKDGIDTVIGTIHEKDFFKAYMSGEKNINSILQNALYTTEHIKISSLLKQIQKKKTHIAIVLDEYGGTLGLITLEDILEELVGEIYDEHDEEVNFFKKVGDNTYIVDGNAPLSDTFELLGVDENEDDYDTNTLSGFIIEYLGEMPRAGKTFSKGNLTFEILKSSVKKIIEVKISLKENNDE